MNQRFALFCRAGVYYCEDRTTGKQTSLRTRDKNEASTLLLAKNESHRQPVLNLQIARVYLSAGDPALSARTWQHVMDEIIATKTGRRASAGIMPARIKHSIPSAAGSSSRPTPNIFCPC